MPPAFNLSQDQTLQFDLDLLNGIDETIYMIPSNFRERLKSKRLDTRHQASKLTFKRPRLSAVNF